MIGTASLGVDVWLSAVAFGASRIVVLTTGEEAPQYLDALREQMNAAPKAWIFTSATLGDDDALSWFTEQAGLADARTLRVGSDASHPGGTAGRGNEAHREHPAFGGVLFFLLAL